MITSVSPSRTESCTASSRRVFEQIQLQGDMTDIENKSLKELLILTSDDGFNDSFFADVLQGIEVPFGVIDQVPLFPGCESLSTNEEQKDCMSKEISMHVNKNFNTKLADELKLIGRQRIHVIFKINREGDIVDVRSRAPHPALEAEAIRVIKTLPKMIPGKQKGKFSLFPHRSRLCPAVGRMPLLSLRKSTTSKSSCDSDRPVQLSLVFQ